MYTVTLNLNTQAISITASTFEAVRSVARAKVETLIAYPDHYSNPPEFTIRVLRSEPLDIGTRDVSLVVTPPVLWSSVEQFVKVSLAKHAQRLEKHNLKPLTSEVKYKIIEKDQMLKDSSLIELSMKLQDTGLLRVSVSN